MTDNENGPTALAAVPTKPRPRPFGVPSFRTGDYRAIYSNVCEITVTQWDIQLLFGRGGGVLGETKVEEVATLYLSPLQAKSVLRVLAGQIKAYEARFGEIKVQADAAEKPQPVPDKDAKT